MPQRSSDRDSNEEKFLHDQAEAFRLHQAVFNLSGLAIIFTTADGLITQFNHAAEEMLGYTAGEVVGKVTPAIFHDSGEVATRAEEWTQTTGKKKGTDFEALIERARHRSVDREEWTFIRKDGTRFSGSLTVIPVTDEHGQMMGIAGLIDDLSEQKAWRRLALISDEKFRLLAENIPGAIYLCRNDESYSTIYINKQIESITGYPREEFLEGKRTFAGIFHPDDMHLIRSTIDDSIAKRKSFQIRYRIRHASGEWRWIDETGVGVYEGNELTMLEGFMQDVTSEKEAEEQLLMLAEQNLRFFNNPVNLNAVADFDGNLVRISPSWTKMLGWTEEELKSRPVFSLIHRDDLQKVQKEIVNVATTTSVHTFENRLMCKDGSYRWLLWALAPDPSAKIVYASAIDISERKRSEENILDSKSNLEGLTLQLQKQNRKLDEFAHIISHNLRAPVNNILALINLLNDDSDITDYKVIYEKLGNVAKNISETMNELMDTLKVKTEAHVDLVELRFKEVLDKVVQSLEGELIVAGATVTFDFNQAPALHYSKPYLESIFQNLLTNAIKYRAPNRRPAIHFRSFMHDDRLILQVKDNGQGIDMQKFGDKLFGLHKTFHEHKEARGVGLFLVKSQIEALGGTISVESEVDTGTTFTIKF